jgi:Icc-related predicted phosphoesterase
MKCLLVSDLHYAIKQFDWIHHAAHGFEVIAIAGDHLDISSTVALEAQIAVILKYLRRLRAVTQLVVCSGNHDLNWANPEGEKVARWMTRVRGLDIATDGDSLQTGDGTLFTICPWWDGPGTREAVGLQLAADAAKPKSRWIWIYHAPPDDSPVSWTGKRHFGDSELSQWIRRHRPNMVLSGHIHQSPFREGGSWADKIGDTWVFNSGRQIGPVPTHTIIDTGAGRAEWYSLAGPQYVELEKPLVRPIPELPLAAP